MEREMFLIGLPIAFVLFLIAMSLLEKRKMRKTAIATVKELNEVQSWLESLGNNYFEMEPVRFPEFRVVAQEADVILVRVFELVLHADRAEATEFGLYEVNLLTGEVKRREQTSEN